MRGIMRVSTLSWENVDQLAVITPNDIFEITAMVGKEIEDLAQFLEKKYPGIVLQLCEQYLALVLGMLPAGSVPTLEEVKALAESLRAAGAGDQHIRNEVTQRFYGVVNMDSPEYAKRAMIAMIEFALGEQVEVLNSAGFTQCNFEDSNFNKNMAGSDRDACMETLLNADRKKAEVLIQIITERRLAA